MVSRHRYVGKKGVTPWVSIPLNESKHEEKRIFEKPGIVHNSGTHPSDVQ